MEQHLGDHLQHYEHNNGFDICHAWDSFGWCIQSLLR
jgi:hypothetical protein